jgi:WhiB family redox-sensing transcriptional regulator
VTNPRRPPRLTDTWEWQLEGRCRSMEVSTFFVPDYTSRDVRRGREGDAHAICLRCPVRPECAAHALFAGERYGIWGGFTEAERRRLLVIGWEDLADRDRRRVDVAGLLVRLGNGSRPRRTRPRSGRRVGERGSETLDDNTILSRAAARP